MLSANAVQRIGDSPIQSLIVTDSLPIPAEKRPDWLEVVSVAPLLADAIHAVHEGESVSELFR